jgi:hypothetical protein
MLMQVLIERARHVSQEIGYSQMKFVEFFRIFGSAWSRGRNRTGAALMKG